MNARRVVSSVLFLAVLCETRSGRTDDLTVRMILENARQRSAAAAKDREALNAQSEASREKLKIIREVEGWAAWL